MILYLALFAVSKKSSFLFQILGCCCMILSGTLADFLGVPLFKPRPPVEPLKL